MRNYSKFVLWIVFSLSVSLSAQEKDTLYIRFSDSLLNKSVFINEIDIYGDSITEKKTDNIVFLFSYPDLVSKLKKIKETDNIIQLPNGDIKLTMVGYSAGPPQYGVELDYYHLDIDGYERYRKWHTKYSDLIQSIKDKGVEKEKQLRFKKDLFETLFPPLQQLYVQLDFLQGKTIFSYTGTKKSYKQLNEKLENYRIVYVVMPFDFSNIYNYEYQLIQVKERYIMPGL